MTAREFRHAVRSEIYSSLPDEDYSGVGADKRYATQIAYGFQALNVGVGIVPNVVVRADAKGHNTYVPDATESSEVEIDAEDDVEEREASLQVQEKKRTYGKAFARFKEVVGKREPGEGPDDLHINIDKVIAEVLKGNIVACRQTAKTSSHGIGEPQSSSYNGFLPPIYQRIGGGGDSSDSIVWSKLCPEDGDLLGEGGFGVVFSRGKVDHDGEVTCIATKFFVQGYEGEPDDRIRSAHLDEKIINRKIGRILTEHTLLLTDQRLARLKPSANQLQHIDKRNTDAYKASDCATIIHKEFYINYLTFPGLMSVQYFIDEPNFVFEQSDITRFISTLKEVAIKCHDNEFVHSDINPDNVMFDRNTRKFYVIDFDSEHTRLCYGIIIPECHNEEYNDRWVYPGYILTAIQKLYMKKYKRFIGVKKTNYGSKVFTGWDQEAMVGDYSHCIMAILLSACEMVPVDKPDKKAIQMRLWYDNVEAAEGGGLQWKTDHSVPEYYGPKGLRNYLLLGTSVPDTPLTPEQAQSLALRRVREARQTRQEQELPKRGGYASQTPSEKLWSTLLGIGVCLLLTAASSIVGSSA